MPRHGLWSSGNEVFNVFDAIRIGDRLEITLIREKVFGKAHVSQVEDIYENNELLVHTPISYGQIVKLSTTEQYSMLFFTEKGMIDFRAEVVGYKKDKEFNFMIVRLVSGGEKIQRREFFRYTCLIPLKFGIVRKKKEQDEEELPLSDGIIKDLGGGGVRFVTNESVEEDCTLKCVIMLGDQCIMVMGKILHKQFFPKSNYKFQYRIEFLDTSANEQEQIIQFIFREQRKEAQKNRP